MKTIQRTLCLILCAVLLISAAPTALANGPEDYTVFDGYCGDNLKWKMNGSTLLIFGEGEMYDFTYDTQPWAEKRNQIYALYIEGKVANIGACAFSYCMNLESAYFRSDENGVTAMTSIGEYAFLNCSSLKNIQLPDSLKEVGKGAFYSCTSLKRIAIPRGITQIPDNTFFGCTSLECVVIPEGVESIGGSAFFNCLSLRGARLPRGLRSLGANAFSNCYGYMTAVFPESIEEIDPASFGGSTGFYEIKYERDEASYRQKIIQGEGAEKFENAIFDYEIRDAYSCGENAFWKYDPDMDEIIVYGSGDMYDYDSPFDAPWGDFSGGAHLVTVRDGITRVGSCAFAGMTRLARVWFGNTVESIGDNAFSKCYNLYSTNVPESLKSVGKGAFSSCDRIARFVLPDGATEISDKAFHGCSSLMAVVIPGGVKTVGEESFMECESAQYIEIKNGVEVVKTDAFESCSSVSTAYVPRSIKKIERFAFAHCNSLTDIYFGGTEEEWEGAVEYSEYDTALQNATVHFAASSFPIRGETSGGVTWEFYRHRLSFLGNGRTDDYDSSAAAPWRDFDIEKVYISSGVEKIGREAFRNLGEGWHFEYEGTEEEWEALAAASYFGDEERAVPVVFGVEFVAPTRCDLTGDGLITLNDLSDLKGLIAGSLELDEERLEDADINADCLLTLKDIVEFKALLAGTND